MAVYAIGDIQGCHDELRALLARLDFDPQRDRLWFTGDLVNRGPHSLAVLRFVKALGERAVTVLGNHDLHLLAVAAGARPLKARDTFGDVLAAPDREPLLEWLRHRPLLHHDESLGWTLVHAGLPPQWDLAQARACAAELEAVLRGPHWREFLHEMYGNEPDRWSDTLTGKARLRFIVNAFTRLRYCSADGRLDLATKLAPGSQPEGFMPWFEVPGRASAVLRIVFGHWSTLGPVTAPNLLPLDTGCVWGGALTARRLDGDGATVAVACRAYQTIGTD
ncbi:MAG TPA: symmetrical bis(5'-nucleosyl)-tetraphosphatase [Gammaproteobacteria bacterium]|nr:symmetrical bis(5'-nucleosyl)-tetraphosphatase [Gammaproteobacteria bacterium]